MKINLLDVCERSSLPWWEMFWSIGRSEKCANYFVSYKHRRWLLRICVNLCQLLTKYICSVLLKNERIDHRSLTFVSFSFLSSDHFRSIDACDEEINNSFRSKRQHCFLIWTIVLIILHHREKCYNLSKTSSKCMSKAIFFVRLIQLLKSIAKFAFFSLSLSLFTSDSDKIISIVYESNSQFP